jgi:hypothetical protein
VFPESVNKQFSVLGILLGMVVYYCDCLVWCLSELWITSCTAVSHIVDTIVSFCVYRVVAQTAEAQLDMVTVNVFFIVQ